MVYTYRDSEYDTQAAAESARLADINSIINAPITELISAKKIEELEPNTYLIHPDELSVEEIYLEDKFWYSSKLTHLNGPVTDKAALQAILDVELKNYTDYIGANTITEDVHAVAIYVEGPPTTSANVDIPYDGSNTVSVAMSTGDSNSVILENLLTALQGAGVIAELQHEAIIYDLSSYTMPVNGTHYDSKINGVVLSYAATKRTVNTLTYTAPTALKPNGG